MTGAHPSREDLLLWIEEAHDRAEEIAEHVAACGACRGSAADIRRLAAALSLRTAALREAPARAFASRRGIVPFPRRVAVAVAAAALLLLAIGIFGVPWRHRVARRPVVAMVEPVPGPGRAAAALRLGDPVEAGETAVRVRFPDGSVATLDRRSRLARIAPREVSLEAGRVHVAAAGGSRFSVRTPAGRVVDLGTVFLVEVEGGAARVVVLRGRVRAEPASGEPFEIATGLEAPISAGAAPARADVAVRSGWVRDLLLPARLENGRVGALLDRLEAVGPWRIEAPASLRARRVTGTIEGGSVEAILQAISAVTRAPRRIDGDRVVFEEPR